MTSQRKSAAKKQNLLCLKNSKIISNQDLQFKFNPFGGITLEELPNIIIPKSHFNDIIKLIHSPTPAVIELVGKKGRGKTTHLNFLQQNFPEYPIVHLSARNKVFPEKHFNQKMVFIDSIHHLPFFKKIHIYKKIEKVILTTHVTRIIEYKWAGKKHHSFYFKGLEKKVLRQVIQNRIQSALRSPTQNNIDINDKYLSQLLNKFNDDFRGILNHLYENFEH